MLTLLNKWFCFWLVVVMLRNLDLRLLSRLASPACQKGGMLFQTYQSIRNHVRPTRRPQKIFFSEQWIQNDEVVVVVVWWWWCPAAARSCCSSCCWRCQLRCRVCTTSVQGVSIQYGSLKGVQSQKFLLDFPASFEPARFVCGQAVPIFQVLWRVSVGWVVHGGLPSCHQHELRDYYWGWGQQSMVETCQAHGYSGSAPFKFQWFPTIGSGAKK